MSCPICEGGLKRSEAFFYYDPLTRLQIKSNTKENLKTIIKETRMANGIFPTLYGMSSTGKVLMWDISVSSNPFTGFGYITVKRGYLTGEKQENTEIIEEGKNIGKANETTPFEQAVSEAQSKWNKKKDKNYTEEIPTESTVKPNLLPMLAHKFDKRKHNIKYPAMVQPKLNGVRCVATKIDEDEIRYTSRGGKVWQFFDHLTPYLLADMKTGESWDGEIFNPKFTFQEITALVKKKKPETKELQYWVYDKISDENFATRTLNLMMNIGTNEFIVCVPTFNVRDETDIMDYHKDFIEANYEGTMVRNCAGPYKCDSRSADLQKIKEYKSAEFKIVGGVGGKGKFANCCVFICVTNEGNEFRVNAPGTLKDREDYLTNIDQCVNKVLTITFEDYSKKGIPLKPIGEAIRDYE